VRAEGAAHGSWRKAHGAKHIGQRAESTEQRAKRNLELPSDIRHLKSDICPFTLRTFARAIPDDWRGMSGTRD
jgi:hypothetical protein